MYLHRSQKSLSKCFSKAALQMAKSATMTIKSLSIICRCCCFLTYGTKMEYQLYQRRITKRFWHIIRQNQQGQGSGKGVKMKPISAIITPLLVNRNQLSQKIFRQAILCYFCSIIPLQLLGKTLRKCTAEFWPSRICDHQAAISTESFLSHVDWT